MKQKNYKWLFYTILILLLCAIAFFALKDITPVSEHIEKLITVNVG